MTTGEVKRVVKRHRPAAVLGVTAGLVLILGWFGYDVAMTPAKPDVATADASEIVAFISDERGLTRLPQIEQEQFLDLWKDRVARPGEDQALRECLEELSDEARKRFADAMVHQVKRSYIDDAQAYAKLTDPMEKDRFLRERIAEYSSQGAFAKKVASSFKGSAPRNQDELNRLILEKTTPEERAIGEPYYDDLKRMREQIRKEERARASAAS